jgi:hypothetical protein
VPCVSRVATYARMWYSDHGCVSEPATPTFSFITFESHVAGSACPHDKLVRNLRTRAVAVAPA